METPGSRRVSVGDYFGVKVCQRWAEKVGFWWPDPGLYFLGRAIVREWWSEKRGTPTLAIFGYFPGAGPVEEVPGREIVTFDENFLIKYVKFSEKAIAFFNWMW